MHLHLFRNSGTRFPWFIAAALLVIAAGCGRDSSSGKFLARVGSSELTQEELARVSDSLGIIRSSSRSFVEEWVASELLYQEAQRRGLTESAEFHSRLEAARKQLAIDALLQKEVYAPGAVTLSDEDVASFFQANASQFTLKEDVVQLSYVLFSERDDANAFRANVLHGTAWDEALSRTRGDSLSGRYVRAIAARQFFTQATLYPEELWKLARTLSREEPSFAVRAGSGYYIVVVHGIQHAGETPRFEYVKEDVRNRLLIDKRRERYEKLLSEIRSRQVVDLAPDLIDTLAESK